MTVYLLPVAYEALFPRNPVGSNRAYYTIKWYICTEVDRNVAIETN